MTGELSYALACRHILNDSWSCQPPIKVPNKLMSVCFYDAALVKFVDFALRSLQSLCIYWLCIALDTIQKYTNASSQYCIVGFCIPFSD